MVKNVKEEEEEEMVLISLLDVYVDVDLKARERERANIIHSLTVDPRAVSQFFVRSQSRNVPPCILLFLWLYGMSVSFV